MAGASRDMLKQSGNEPLVIGGRRLGRHMDGLMQFQPTDADVVKFLRGALAKRACPVVELEASARAAGLLKERQRIAQAKPFRRAKEFLRMRSHRAGFGARSHWLWELPRASVPSAKAQRASAPPRRIPSHWVEGVAYLNPERPPADVPRHRWRQFVDDCKRFLNSPENWAEHAARLGWDAMALFGCAPRRPLEACQSRDVPVSISLSNLLCVMVGAPVEFSSPLPLYQVARDFPKCDFVISHAAWPWVFETIGLAFAWSNIFVSPDLYMVGLNMPGAAEYINAANSFLADRLLFGTAYPSRPIVESVQEFKKWSSKPGVEEKVLGKNALRVMRMEV